MKILLTIIPFLFLLTARSCDKKVAEDQNQEPVFSLGETLNLAFQKKTSIKSEGLSIDYQGLEDSRCPEGTQCIRAGEAVIKLVLEKDGKSETVNMEVRGMCMGRDGKCGSSKQVMGYNIQLLTADPYPQGNSPKPLESTSVRVKVNSL